MGSPGGRPQNLKPFQKGKPRAPGAGAQKGQKNLLTILKKILDKELDAKDPLTHKKCRRTVAEFVNLALIARAMQGNIPAIREIYDRVLGKVADKQSEQTKDDIIASMANVVNELTAKHTKDY
jgi:hypothetical protein